MFDDSTKQVSSWYLAWDPKKLRAAIESKSSMGGNSIENLSNSSVGVSLPHFLLFWHGEELSSSVNATEEFIPVRLWTTDLKLKASVSTYWVLIYTTFTGTLLAPAMEMQNLSKNLCCCFFLVCYLEYSCGGFYIGMWFRTVKGDRAMKKVRFGWTVDWEETPLTGPSWQSP